MQNYKTCHGLYKSEWEANFTTFDHTENLEIIRQRALSDAVFSSCSYLGIDNSPVTPNFFINSITWPDVFASSMKA